MIGPSLKISGAKRTQPKSLNQTVKLEIDASNVLGETLGDLSHHFRST